MNQVRIILAVAIVGLATAAIWTWHQNSQPADTKVARTEASTSPFRPQGPPIPTSANTPAPAPTPSTAVKAETPPPPPEDNQSAASTNTDRPNVDTPEPAERKFARGGKADSDQN